MWHPPTISKGVSSNYRAKKYIFDNLCNKIDNCIVPELEILNVNRLSNTKCIIVNVQPQYNGHNFCWRSKFSVTGIIAVMVSSFFLRESLQNRPICI